MGMAAGMVMELRPVLSSRPMLAALALFLALDLGVLLIHAAHVLAEYQGLSVWVADPRFSIENDEGYGERYEYVKTACCVLALGGCWAATRQPLYVALAAIFTFVLMDNALQIHESVGHRAAAHLGAGEAVFEGAAQALGEVAVFAAAGLAALALFALAFRRSGLRHRRLGLAFLLLLLGLGGFGIGVDLLHAALSGSRRLDRLFGFIEDGGELVILSLAAALAIALRARLAGGARREAAVPAAPRRAD